MPFTGNQGWHNNRPPWKILDDDDCENPLESKKKGLNAF